MTIVPTAEAAATFVKGIVAEQLHKADGLITPGMILADLGATSLDLYGFFLAIEEEYDCTVPDEASQKCKTVQDLIGLVPRPK